MGEEQHARVLSRRGFLAGLTATGAAAVLGHGRGAAAGDRPNIVFFLVDDLGWMDTTTYGSQYYETPNVERLARRSVRFTDAYSAAPLCTATRASIMTGKYPGRLHITGASGHLPLREGPLMPESAQPHEEILSPRCQGYLPLEEYTLAEALKDAGYRTGFVGKWHLGHDEKFWPEHQGFDVNVGGGRWPGPPSYFSPYGISKLPDGPDGEYIADRLTDEALAFIDESKDAPFYLNLWQYAVHAPYQCKEDYRDHFEQKKDPRGAQRNAVMGAMIKSMDESLGRVLDKLEELGLMDNTIIIFSSDNGGNMYDRTMRDGTNLGPMSPEGRTPTNNAPLRSGKGSVYEGGIRVPTMVYWPGKVAGDTVSHEPICSIDFYPTLLDMLDIAPRPGQVFDGISFAPALEGRRLRRRALYGHFPHFTQVVPCRQASWVRAGDWKLIRFYELDENFPNRLELYNLNDDLSEMWNLAEACPKRACDLERMLDRHLAETGALVPKPNPNYRPEAAREIAGWRPSGQCWIEPAVAGLILHSTGGDPFIVNTGAPDAAGRLVARFRMRSTSAGPGQFFWTTQQGRRFGPQRRLDFAPAHDDAWHEYAVPFEADAPLEAVRLDPSVGPGTVTIEWIRIEDAQGNAVKEWRFSR
ncbi:MAG: sulfatase [Candidatus Hydrogenedentes bacterium]|nr:sulfatase [Candidatus Hydrogenedentota bacterium]